MDVSHQVAGLLNQALEGISAAARRSGLIDFDNEVQVIKESVADQVRDIISQERSDKLCGQGPTASIRRRIGLQRSEPTNHFALVEEDDRLDDYVFRQLIEVTFPTQVTHFARGGSAPVIDNDHPDLPENPDDWRGGLYKGPRGAPMLVIPVSVGITISYLLYVFKRDAWESDTIVVVTYVDVEREWVYHEFLDVLSKKVVQKSFRHEVFNATGYLPPGGITYRTLDDFVVAHHALLAPVTHVRDQGLELRLITDLKNPTSRWIAVFDNARTREDGEASWSELDPVYQNRLFDKLKELVKQDQKEVG